MINKHQLKLTAKSLEPVMRIGKHGLTENVIREISRLLKKNRLIKVRILKNIAKEENKKEIIENIIDKTNSTLIEQVGNVFVLYK